MIYAKNFLTIKAFMGLLIRVSRGVLADDTFGIERTALFSEIVIFGFWLKTSAIVTRGGVGERVGGEVVGSFASMISDSSVITSGVFGTLGCLKASAPFDNVAARARSASILSMFPARTGVLTGGDVVVWKILELNIGPIYIVVLFILAFVCEKRGRWRSYPCQLLLSLHTKISFRPGTRIQSRRYNAMGGWNEMQME